jgi:hypothetical protein
VAQSLQISHLEVYHSFSLGQGQGWLAITSQPFSCFWSLFDHSMKEKAILFILWQLFVEKRSFSGHSMKETPESFILWKK